MRRIGQGATRTCTGSVRDPRRKKRRHEIKKVLSMLFLFLVMVGTGYAGDSDRPPADYQGPVAERPQFVEGDRWEYTWQGQVYSSVFSGEKDGQLIFLEKWRDGPQWTVYRTADLNFIKSLHKQDQEVKEECKPYRGPFGFPLWVGKKWTYNFSIVTAPFSGKMKKRGGLGGPREMESRVKVVAYEQVTVPAGTLWAFKIEEVRRPEGSKGMRDYHFTLWYSPEVKNFIKIEEDKETWNRELVGYTLSGRN
jgi:hypothetical protein